MVNNTTAMVSPALIFSLVSKNKAMAVPPTVEGVTDDPNSHKLIT